MRVFISYAAVFIFISCSVVNIDEQRPLSGMNVTEAWAWIDENITYKADIVDDFQRPNTTYQIRTGDCEDFCILLMSVMAEQNEKPPELVAIRYGNSIHYVIKWANTFFEAQVPGMFYEKNFIDSNFLWSFSYEKCLEMGH